MRFVFELETWVNNLRHHFLGKKVSGISGVPGVIRNFDFEEILPRILNLKLIRIERVARFVVLEFEKKHNLIFDLYESGTFNVSNSDSLKSTTRLILSFKDSQNLRVEDKEKNSTVEFFTGNPHFSKLLENKGIDIKFLDYEKFRKILKAVHKSVKVSLSDQHHISGLSPADVDEILLRANLFPKIVASSLSDLQIEKVYSSVVSFIRETLSKVKDQMGQQTFSLTQPAFLILYKKEGKVCNKCGSIIKKVRIGEYETLYCPSCQKQKA